MDVSISIVGAELSLSNSSMSFVWLEAVTMVKASDSDISAVILRFLGYSRRTDVIWQWCLKLAEG